MRKLFTTIFFLLFSTYAFGANIYINPDWGGTESGTYAEPYNSWSDISFTSSNNYYQKCGTSEATRTSSITITGKNTITIGAYYAENSFDLAGCLSDSARPIIDSSVCDSGSCDTVHDIFRIQNSDDITIQTLDLRGGADCIEINDTSSGSDNFTLKDCIVGSTSRSWGVRTTGSFARTGYDIHDNTIQADGNALWDGIALTYTSNSTIKNNTIADWRHVGISISNNSDSNLIYENFITGSNEDDMSPIEIYSESSTGNKYYRNWMLNLASGGKLMGVLNEMYYNVWAFIGATASSPGVGLQMGAGSASTGDSYNNKLYNNTFYKIDGFGIKIANYGANQDITGLDITNNALIETGDCWSGSAYCDTDNEYPLWLFDWGQNDITGNTFQNNDIYTSDIGRSSEVRTADLVRFLDTNYSIAGFNGLSTPTTDNTMTNNINTKDQMVDPDDEKFWSGSGCPFIDAGIIPSGFTSIFPNMPASVWHSSVVVATKDYNSLREIGFLASPPIIAVAATDDTAEEEGTTTGTWTISCSPDCAGETVDFTYTGSATLDADYDTAEGEDVEDGDLTITGASDTITLTPVDDAEQDISEVATLTIDSGTGYTVGSPSSANITIIDNDGAQEAGVSGMGGLGVGSGSVIYDSSGSGSWTR